MGCSSSSNSTSGVHQSPSFYLTIKPREGLPFKLRVNKEELVRDIKKRIAQAGTPFDQQRLLYNGIQLEDHTSLAENNITLDATLQLVVKLTAPPKEEVKYAPKLSQLVSNDPNDPANYKPQLLVNNVQNVLTDEQLAAANSIQG